MKYVKLNDIKAKVEQAEIDAHWDNEVFSAEYVNDVLDFIPYIEDIQPAVKAEWIEVDGHKHQCSHCHFTTNPWTASFYNYCPNCGAYIEGVKKVHENNLEKAKEIIKEHYKNGDCGIFNTRNILGDPMVNIYDDNDLVIDICYSYSYFEVFGLSDDEFVELEKYYIELGEV